jgi:DNA-binding YbaB/EbfC family protein
MPPTRKPQAQQQALMRQMQDMQRQQEEIQAKLREEVVEASAGGGMVTVKVSGALEVKSVSIDPEAVDPDDVELLQDMILAATNEAIRAATERAEQAQMNLLGPLAQQLGGLGLPGL